MASSDSTTYAIYRIVNFRNGKVYVGLTSSVKTRKSTHFNKLKCGNHENAHLQNAYNKYGLDAFYFEILERDVSFSEINERERFWISYFDSYVKGYNRTLGGELGGYGHACTWNGIEYKSMSEAADKNNITVTTMWERLKRGYTSDKDVNMPRTLPFIWNGITYPSVYEAAKVNNVSVNALYNRTYRGQTSDADMPGWKGSPGTVCYWNGIEYPSIRQCATANDISMPAMLNRLRKGFSCDADVRKPKRPCVWNGIYYASQDDADKANGLSSGATHYRLQRGYTCDTDMKHK